MADYQINKRLADAKLGNYLIKVTNIGQWRQSKFCSYEYYVTVKYQITDVNNPNRTTGVMAPGFGPKPIELNKNREDSFMFFDFQNFDDELFNKLSMRMRWINEEGYYLKEGRKNGSN